MSQIIFGYITIENINQAEELVEKLLEKKFIACANIFPIKSMYTWKGKIEKSNEIVIIIKTLQEKWNETENFIKQNHSYEIPCITKISVDANKEFEEWVKGVL